MKEIKLKATCPTHGEFSFVLRSDYLARMQEKNFCYWCYVHQIVAVVDRLFEVEDRLSAFGFVPEKMVVNPETTGGALEGKTYSLEDLKKQGKMESDHCIFPVCSKKKSETGKC